MKKNTLFWITGIVLVAVLLLFVPSMLMFGRGGFMHDGGYSMMDGYSNTGPSSTMMGGDYDGYGMMGDYGGYSMMGSGWMTFGWIIPVFILILIIGAGVWLGNSLTNRGINSSASPARTCSNCNKPAEADWKVCPHCSVSLE